MDIDHTASFFVRPPSEQVQNITELPGRQLPKPYIIAGENQYDYVLQREDQGTGAILFLDTESYEEESTSRSLGTNAFKISKERVKLLARKYAIKGASPEELARLEILNQKLDTIDASYWMGQIDTVLSLREELEGKITNIDNLVEKYK